MKVFKHRNLSKTAKLCSKIQSINIIRDNIIIKHIPPHLLLCAHSHLVFHSVGIQELLHKNILIYNATKTIYGKYLNFVNTQLS